MLITKAGPQDQVVRTATRAVVLSHGNTILVYCRQDEPAPGLIGEKLDDVRPAT